MNTTIKARKSEVKQILAITFPEYAGRTFRVEYCTQVGFYDTNWGGGTRNTYAAVQMKTGKVGRLVAKAPWINTVEGQRIDLPEDMVIVEHSIFCGKDMGIRFYVHESHRQSFLTAGGK